MADREPTSPSNLGTPTESNLPPREFYEAAHNQIEGISAAEAERMVHTAVQTTPSPAAAENVTVKITRADIEANKVRISRDQVNTAVAARDAKTVRVKMPSGLTKLWRSIKSSVMGRPG